MRRESVKGSPPVSLISHLAITPELHYAVPAMPLYEYEHVEDIKGRCGGAFTLRRPLEAPELKVCPACRKPVRKLFSTFNTPKAANRFSLSQANDAGFTVLKKVSKGEYSVHKPKRNAPGT
jgi:predicted nucleic acid-binding Zn ribbon protein